MRSPPPDAEQPGGHHPRVARQIASQPDDEDVSRAVGSTEANVRLDAAQANLSWGLLGELPLDRAAASAVGLIEQARHWLQTAAGEAVGP